MSNDTRTIILPRAGRTVGPAPIRFRRRVHGSWWVYQGNRRLGFVTRSDRFGDWRAYVLPDVPAGRASGRTRREAANLLALHLGRLVHGR